MQSSPQLPFALDLAWFHCRFFAWAPYNTQHHICIYFLIVIIKLVMKSVFFPERRDGITALAQLASIRKFGVLLGFLVIISGFLSFIYATQTLPIFFRQISRPWSLLWFFPRPKKNKQKVVFLEYFRRNLLWIYTLFVTFCVTFNL